MFSHLSSDFRGKKNRIYKEYNRILSSGTQVIDLVSGNVNQNGISYPQKTLEEILREASRLARIYKPNPMGQPSARLAIQKFSLFNNFWNGKLLELTNGKEGV